MFTTVETPFNVSFDETTKFYHVSSPLRPSTVAISNVKEEAIEILESYLHNFS